MSALCESMSKRLKFYYKKVKWTIISTSLFTIGVLGFNFTLLLVQYQLNFDINYMMLLRDERNEDKELNYDLSTIWIA